MSIKIYNVEWEYTNFTPLSTGETKKVRGGVSSASFECQCGNQWHAFSKQSLEPGHFFQSSSGITVKCAQCNETLKFAREKYNNL